MEPVLGRLTTVPAREIWPHEAHSFTPWVLANVDVLSDLLGMDLVLDRAEHPVGNFSLDLIGRDQMTDRVVIVENQLETSDHGHLGQLLTYAAGTAASTVVWMTTGWREEHRAALDWLNEHTDEEIRFFGVEISVVRIGDSAAAPAFRLVAQPNNWGKQVKSAAAAVPGERTELQQLYWDFWDRFRSRVQSERPGWSRARSSTWSSWFDTSIAPNVLVSSYFSRDGLVAQVYFSSPDAATNAARFDHFLSRRDRFEAGLGGVADWNPMPGKKAARIALLSPFASVRDTAAWPAMVDWLLDAQTRLRAAVDAVGGVPRFEPAEPEQ